MGERRGCCSKLCHPLSKEFSSDNFRFDHLPVDDFFKSQWQTGTRSWIYVIYRWLLACFFTGGVISSLIIQFENGKYFIYLTNLGFILCMVTNIIGAILATVWFIRPNHYVNQTFIIKLFWLIHITTLTLALIITTVYWSALYPIIENNSVDVFNIFAHACNSVLMVFDQMMIAFPTRILHLIYPLIFGLLYGLFSLIYYFAGGLDIFGNAYIYPILNWEKPGIAIGSMIGVCLLLCIAIIINFSLYKLRRTIYRKCRKSEINFN